MKVPHSKTVNRSVPLCVVRVNVTPACIPCTCKKESRVSQREAPKSTEVRCETKCANCFLFCHYGKHSNANSYHQTLEIQSPKIKHSLITSNTQLIPIHITSIVFDSSINARKWTKRRNLQGFYKHEILYRVPTSTSAHPPSLTGNGT